MRTLNVSFEEKTFKELQKIKDSQNVSWEAAIIRGLRLLKSMRKRTKWDENCMPVSEDKE